MKRRGDAGKRGRGDSPFLRVYASPIPCLLCLCGESCIYAQSNYQRNRDRGRKGNDHHSSGRRGRSE